jgi:hypothetical protein
LNSNQPNSILKRRKGTDLPDWQLDFERKDWSCLDWQDNPKGKESLHCLDWQANKKEE